MYTINSLNLMNEPAGQYILTIELSEEDGGGGGKGEKEERRRRRGKQS